MATPVKKAKTVEAGLNDDESEALEMIDSCQNEIDALNEKASEEILKIEEKYNTLRKPLFDKRNTIIKSIPHFWVTAFINHPQISGILEAEEEECLNHLEKIDVEDFDDIKSGYTIKFYFAENPYFENKLLTKEFNLNGANGPKSVSTEIKWKESHDLLKQLQFKPTNTKRKRHLEYRTFFDWFTDNTDPANDEIGELIKDDLWPNPLQYFLVPDIEVEPEEGEDCSDEGDEMGEEDFDDDEEDDDEGDEGEAADPK